MKNLTAHLIGLACAALFVGTAWWLLMARIEEGNVYPPGSGLRSDPLGAMILWESLSSLPGFTVERNQSPLPQLPPGRNTTYLHVGTSVHDWLLLSTVRQKAIDQFLAEGGRLIVTLHPNPLWSLEDVDQKADPSPPASPSPTPSSSRERRQMALKKHWEFALATDKSTEAKLPATKAAPLQELPENLPWHSRTVLKDLGAGWTVAYTRNGHPVIAEMKRGSGTLVLLTDSYLLSNEALVHDRQPALLAWLIGPHSRVVFDEALHGITETPGLAAMARRYGLTGAAGALLIWVGLFLWKNSSSLAPRQKKQAVADEPIPGRPAFDGFVSMLRRHVPPSELFGVCWAEWEKTFARSRCFAGHRKAAARAVATAEAARPAQERDPLAAWRRVHRVLHHPSAEP